MQVVIPARFQTGISDLLAATISAGVVELYSGAVDLDNPALTKTDFTPPTFTGYTPIFGPETQVDKEGGGFPVVFLPQLQYRTTVLPAVPDTVHGFFIYNGDDLLIAGRFDAPITLIFADQVIALWVKIHVANMQLEAELIAG